jgi:hypothetical protein
MRTNLLFALVGLTLAAAAAPAPAQAQDDLTDELEHIERSLWHGWATHDTAPFKENIVENSVQIGSWGMVAGKAAVLELIASHNCVLEDAQFSAWKAHQLSYDAALLTYHAMQKGSCDGEALPAKVSVSAVYIRHDDRWMSASYHETELTDGM